MPVQPLTRFVHQLTTKVIRWGPPRLADSVPTLSMVSCQASVKSRDSITSVAVLGLSCDTQTTLR
jgi:hypothetical protein